MFPKEDSKATWGLKKTHNLEVDENIILSSEDLA
jgi:hypothetical protein